MGMKNKTKRSFPTAGDFGGQYLVLSLHPQQLAECVYSSSPICLKEIIMWEREVHFGEGSPVILELCSSDV